MSLKNLGDELIKFKESTAQISIIIITFILYLLTKHQIFGILVAFEFIGFVALEIYHGVRKNGIKHEITDVLKSLGIAIFIWLLISVLLRTAVPVSAVVSCSMLPNLQRGDFVIIHGATIAELTAPEIIVSEEELRKIYNPETNVISPYRNFTVNGSIFSYCSANRFFDRTCNSFYSEPEKFKEQRGLLTFTYSNCTRKTFGTNKLESVPCITSVSYNEKEYTTNISNSIIVYEANKGDLFSYTGDIIHRVYLKIKTTENRSYVLTKGDNNNIFDVQFYNYNNGLANTPQSETNIKGTHIFAIPYIGYLKLFISGFVEEPIYCNSNLIYNTNA